MNRSKLLESIEKLFVDLIDCLNKGRPLTFTIRDQKNWANTVFTDRVKLKPLVSATTSQVNFGRTCSQLKFSNMIHIIAKVYLLLATESECTIRELYYQDVEILKYQHKVDSAIRSISCLLDVAPWDLGVISTSKGLIAGPLTITMNSGDTIDCAKSKGGILVPQNADIQSVGSTAKFILLIEKDAVFQKLLDEDVLQSLENCLLVTGKGYPDIGTRHLIHRLWTDLELPILAVVDADPHGIEIMFVYRYGSLAMSHQADELATPQIRWLGIHPTEMNQYDAHTMPLTQRDHDKIQDLLKRPYLLANPELKQQLHAMRTAGKKAEIEGISGISPGYLTGAYLPRKIKAKDFV